MNVIIGGRALLEDAKLRLTYGRKYGLIGRNGIGKTCFMNALARCEFEGMPKHLQILLVEQEMKGNHKSPVQLVKQKLTIIALKRENEMIEINCYI